MNSGFQALVRTNVIVGFREEWRSELKDVVLPNRELGFIVHLLVKMKQLFPQDDADNRDAFGQLVPPKQPGKSAPVFALRLFQIGEAILLVYDQFQADFVKVVFDVLLIPQQRRPQFRFLGIHGV